MDREEFLTKIEGINQFVHKKDYKSALEIVESIEWRKVKSARTLCVAGEVYAANRCYQESKEIFLMAYKRSPVRKNILYRLIEVSIKMEDLEDALKYYQEFLEMSPNDNIHFILNIKSTAQERLRWKTRFRFWRNIRNGNIRKDGLMNWPNCIIKQASGTSA